MLGSHTRTRAEEEEEEEEERGGREEEGEGGGRRSGRHSQQPISCSEEQIYQQGSICSSTKYFHLVAKHTCASVHVLFGGKFTSIQTFAISSNLRDAFCD